MPTVQATQPVHKPYNEKFVSPAAKGIMPDLPPHLVPEDAWWWGKNVRVKRGRIGPRPGFDAVEAGQLVGEITRLAPFDLTDGTQVLVGATPTQLARWLGTTYTAGTVATATPGAAGVTFTPGSGVNLIDADGDATFNDTDIWPGDQIQLEMTDGGSNQQYSRNYVIDEIDAAASLALTENIDAFVSPFTAFTGNYRITRGWRFINRQYFAGTLTVANGSGTVTAAGTPQQADISGFAAAGDHIIIHGQLDGGLHHRKRYRVGAISAGSPDTFVLNDDDGAVAGGWPAGAGTGVAYIIYRSFSAGTNRWGYTQFVDPRLALFANGTDTVRKWNGSWATVRLISGTAQVDTATPANVEVGDTFTISIDGTSVSFVATGATVANVTAGLTVAINGNGTLAALVTAVDSTTHVTITSDIPGEPLHITGTTTNGGAADTQTLTIANTTPAGGGEVCRYLETFENHLILLNLSGQPHAFKWSGYGNPDDYTFDVASYSGGGGLVDDPEEIMGATITRNQLYIFKETHYYTFMVTRGRPALVKSGYFRGTGCALPFSPVASQGTAFWVGRDGFYVDAPGGVQKLGDGTIFNFFSEDMSWDDRRRAHAAYSEVTQEIMLFYISRANAGGRPDRAIVFDAESGAANYWEIEVSAYTEAKRSITVTIDTLEDVYGPMTIDTMPFASIDSIGADTGYRIRFCSSGLGTYHIFGEHYSDNGTSYDAILLSPLMNLMADPSAQALVLWGRLLAERTGSTTTMLFRMFRQHDINAQQLFSTERTLALDSVAVTFRTRAPGTWHQFELKATIDDNYFILTGWSLEYAPMGRRKQATIAATGTTTAGVSIVGGGGGGDGPSGW